MSPTLKIENVELILATVIVIQEILKSAALAMETCSIAPPFLLCFVCCVCSRVVVVWRPVVKKCGG